MSIQYFFPDNNPTVKLESREDLEEIIDILHTQAIDNLGEDSDETHILECWLEELDGTASNWYESFKAVEEQRDLARLYWKRALILLGVSIFANFVLFLWR